MKNILPKLNIEDYLHNIDKVFAQKTQKDTYMIYMMVVAGIFAFAYVLFWDSSFAKFEQTRANVVNLDRKINADNSYLQINPESKIINLDKQIMQINDDMIVHKDNNAYIKSKIETISSLIYDERTWGEYLDSISKNAQKYHVKIKSFSNSYAQTHNSFGHILDITISTTANYKNTFLFINSLETSDLVVDIHDFTIKAQNSLNTDLNISVWGITY
ncbi:type 4a pilus biogenesis protein PilO [Sulfurimonas sp. SAG-AH-194-C21]|nr:type 4a pilus biogenesis protein PilO [Sulfurimonas sp. SAG-AH-194-C21]MDF1882499.1 type 4a pilus biogenesis protein PilO [Sulfurimonas sp. SAG-AH-194-C21]